MQPLTSSRGFDKQTLPTPPAAQKGRKHEVIRFPKKDRPFASPSFFSTGLQTFFKLLLSSTSAFAGIIPTCIGFIPNTHKNCRTGVGLRAIPISSSLFATASTTLAGGGG
jgi:hypothetical protein